MKRVKLLALLLALLTLFAILPGCTAPGTQGTQDPQDSKDSVQSPTDKTYAADGLLNADGKLGNNDDGELRVAFIGGSLTAGETYYDALGWLDAGNEWTNLLCDKLGEVFPNKTIRAYNAGIGGTNSEYGALRFERFVLAFEPDIVFIEFAVNDAYSPLDAQCYMESMVRQAKEMPHEPVIIFLYAPLPVDRNTDLYANWLKGVQHKEEIADYYGIGSINVYEYLYRCYEKSGKASLDEFLSDYYTQRAQGGFDAHGGYPLYYEAIVEALEAAPADLIRKADTPETGFENGVYDDFFRRYVFHEPTDDWLTYEGDWSFYSLERPRDLSGDSAVDIPDNALSYPGSRDGIAETTATGASIAFTTSAPDVYLVFLASAYGNSAQIYLDGEDTGKAVSIESPYSGMTYILPIELPDDGKEHDVRLVTNQPQGNKCYFRFGYVVEAHYKK